MRFRHLPKHICAFLSLLCIMRALTARPALTTQHRFLQPGHAWPRLPCRRIYPAPKCSHEAAGSDPNPVHIGIEKEDVPEVQAFEVHHVHKGFIQKPILLGPAHSWYLGMDVGRPGVVHGEAALPPRMVDKLKGTPASHMDQDKPESKKGPHVLFASVGWEGGGKEEWFINYNPSGCEWGASCSEAMHRVLGENGVRDPPVSVFWGVSGAYLVLRFSGAVEYDNLPGDMAMHVELAIQKHKGLAWAAMGPAGEWLVLAWDDTCWWNGVHPSLARILSIQERPQGNLNFVSLGPDGTYCALFDNRTVWRAKQSFTDHMLQDIV